MEKDQFLRLQYLRMMNSEEFVVEKWRSSMERFVRDMWDRTPTKPQERFLAPIDPSLGFAPDNVEWHFPQIKKRNSKRKLPVELKIDIRKPPSRLTKKEQSAMKIEQREADKKAKRQAIADEFASWASMKQSRF